MTALQYLACTPTAFQTKKRPIKRGVIENLSQSKLETDLSFSDNPKKVTLLDDMRYMFEERLFLTRNECSKLLPRCFSIDEMLTNPKVQRWWLVDVAVGLVQQDDSLKSNINSRPAGLDKETNEHKHKESDENALFIATKYNNKEIVKLIRILRPRSLEQTNEEGLNILHLAILHRHIEIFDMVIQYEMLATRLLSATDKEGNSALHMVSQKRKSRATEKMQNPAFQLRDELRLYEKVKSACKNLVPNPLNKRNETAEELFAVANVKLQNDAKEWLMRTTENCTILSVFIATVAFAAAYTVPGGPDQNTGYPMFRSKPFFVVFLVADVISITCALISVGIFLSILTSSFPLEDFKIYLFNKLIQGIVSLVLSVSMMAVAFGATIVLMMSRNRENVVWSVVAFLPVPIFFLSYSPIRSPVLGLFKPYIVKFLIVVVVVLLILPYKTLCRIVEKAAELILKLVTWIGGKISCTQSPHPKIPPPSTQV